MSLYKHGFCILGCQPFHIGHDRLIKKMMQGCEFGTVVISSAQESGTKNNSLPYFVRKKMIQNVWRNTDAYPRLRIMGIKDVQNVPFDRYVLDAIKKEEPDKLNLIKDDFIVEITRTDFDSKKDIKILGYDRDYINSENFKKAKIRLNYVMLKNKTVEQYLEEIKQYIEAYPNIKNHKPQNIKS